MKTKYFIIAILLSISSLSINAQDKYDFMSITFTPRFESVAISINGKEYIAEKVVLDAIGKAGFNSNPLFKKVEEYQSLDWEVMSFNTIATGQNSDFLYHYAYLRKKKIN